MASSNGASMNASASGVAVTATSPAGRLCELHEVLDVGGGGRGADDHVQRAAGRLLAHPCHLAHRIGRSCHIQYGARGGTAYRAAFGGASQRAASSSAAARSWAGWKWA